MILRIDFKFSIYVFNRIQIKMQKNVKNAKMQKNAKNAKNVKCKNI